MLQKPLISENVPAREYSSNWRTVQIAADFVRRLKEVSQEERQAALARTSGSPSPDEADEVEKT